MKTALTRIKPRKDLRPLRTKSSEVANLLRALANDRRLLLLCKLVETGEATVGTLADEVGLSQSATSQHLALLREEGVIAFRREAQTLWYRLADPKVETLFATLHRLYCG